MPEPLHPWIVHFAVAPLLLGTLVAVLAALVNRWNLPLFAALLLTVGAVGSFAAYFSGEDAEHQAERVTAEVRTLVHEHEEAADLTKFAALAAALLALGAVAVGRREKLALGLRVLTAVVALGACVTLYTTGKLGAQLSHDHNYGPTMYAAPPADSLLAPLHDHHHEGE